MIIHRISLYALYLLTIASIIYISSIGAPYYELSSLDRPHSEQHNKWKPGGDIGHGLGIVGSALLIILFLYSVRKRFRFMHDKGDIRYWLNYHIWMGISGPLLVIFHTSFKFGGIVAISFWSMTAVALSGVFGRYIYIQIPRTKTGKTMNAKEIDEQDNRFDQTLKSDFNLDAQSTDKLLSLFNRDSLADKKGLSGLFYLILNDIQLPFKLNKLLKEIKAAGKIPSSQLKSIRKIAKERAVLRRRVAFLQSAHKLLHHWHLIHRPFALVMILIMLIHVAVAIVFGYKWIF